MYFKAKLAIIFWFSATLNVEILNIRVKRVLLNYTTVILNLLVVDKFSFIFTTETGKPDEAVVIVKEVFSEKHSGSIIIYTILKHLQFSRIAIGSRVYTPSFSLPNSRAWRIAQWMLLSSRSSNFKFSLDKVYKIIRLHYENGRGRAARVVVDITSNCDGLHLASIDHILTVETAWIPISAGWSIVYGNTRWKCPIHPLSFAFAVNTILLVR